MSERINGNVLAHRVAELEKDLKELSSKVDRLMWSIVGLSLTIAGATISVLITSVTG